MMKKTRLARRYKHINRSPVGTAVIFLLVFLFGLVMALPLVLIISNSLKPLDELWIFPPKLFPLSPTLDNFRDMEEVMSSSLVPFTRYFFNTIMITVLGSVGHIVLASMCAFVIAKKRFPGRIVLFTVIELSLMFNSTVTAIPNYLILSWFHWLDTYWAILIPSFGSSLGLYLMKQFIEQLPDSLLEAARIDGASQGRIFWNIVMPNVKSAWLTLLLLQVQSLWNMGNSNFIFSEELKSLGYALNQVLSSGIARVGVGYAVSVFMMVVPIAIFLFTQSNVIETMATSGMKE